MEHVYLLKSGGSSIQNINKRRKIYVELPEKLDAEDDKIMDLDVFKIAASNDNLEKIKSLMPIRKRGRYDYSLTPVQNGIIINEKREEERGAKRLDREKRDAELSRDKYLDGESYVKELFHKAEIPYGGPEQDTITGLLKYLGSKEGILRQNGISKRMLKEVRSKIVNLRFAEIIEESGLTKTAAYKTISLYNLLLDKGMVKESEALFALFDRTSLDNNLLLEDNIV